MISTKYDERGFYIATVDGHETTVYGEDKEKVEATAEDLIDLVQEQIADTENNYGLAFYACGYDGRAQTDFIKYYADEYGVDVF